MRERADGGRLAATLAARHHTGEKGGEGEEGRGVAAADLREEWQAAGRGGGGCGRRACGMAGRVGRRGGRVWKGWGEFIRRVGESGPSDLEIDGP